MELRNLVRNGLLALAIVTTVTGHAVAQRPYGQYNGGHRYGQQRDTTPNVAGKFNYYALVLSWSPSYCAGTQTRGDDPQCNRTDGKRYSFVLHGLWPQFAPKGWPQDCPTADNPFVPRGVINSMLDIMPSDKLVIHEYKKHGTCSGLAPVPYFELARKLFNEVRVPDAYRDPTETKFVSPAELIADFQKVNPWLESNMIGVDCHSKGGNQLREIHICFDREGEPTACSRNEDQNRMCRADKMSLPPVRGGGVRADAAPGTDSAEPAPTARRPVELAPRHI